MQVRVGQAVPEVFNAFLKNAVLFAERRARRATASFLASRLSCGGLLLAILCGCGSEEVPPPPSPADYGRLDGLRASTDGALRDELVRIVGDEGTPEQLAGRTAAEENGAEALMQLFENREVDKLLAEAEEVLPRKDRFDYDPIRLQRAIRFRKTHETLWQDARAAAGSPRCKFQVDFMQGHLVELPMIDVVKVCAYLEAFETARALSQNDVDEAVAAVGSMLRYVDMLAAVAHPDCRLAAAYLRTTGYCVLQSVFSWPDVALRRVHVEQIRRMVAERLAAWTPDSEAWRGERAMGMHAYEMVRDGKLAVLLTEEEIREFRDEEGLEDLDAAAMQRVDDDELFYLEAMRKIIENCEKPFYQRAEAFDAVDADLMHRAKSSLFPLVAGRILLKDVRPAQAIVAEDRANWEAWALALDLATGRTRETETINPLTGLPYRVTTDDRSVRVAGIAPSRDGAEPSIVVPILKTSE